MVVKANLQTKLSDYEIERLERIRKNNEKLAQLGLAETRDSLVASLTPVKTPLRQCPLGFVRKRKQTDPETVRRSSRKAGKPVLYTPEALDDVIVEPKRRRCGQERRESAKKMAVGLSEEQRASLQGAHAWLEDMERFLLHTPHGRGCKTVSEDNARTVMRQVKVLVSGKGVSYHHWKDGVLFAEGEPVTLATDFIKLYHDAVAHENKHGEDRGHGWLLRHPITKLLCYQIYRAEGEENEKK